MIREDYILRLVRKYAQMVARIVGQNHAREYRNALQTIDQASMQLLSLNIGSVIRLSPGQLLAILLDGHDPAECRARCTLLVTLLQQAGIAHAAENRPAESRVAYLQALHILLEVLPRRDGVVLPEFAPAIEDLVSVAREKGLPAETQTALMLYYEQTGQYARAEDCLYAMLEDEPENPGIVDMGIELYERLQQQDDAVLSAGNLPRDEVNDGLIEMRKFKRRP
ncbi:MAG: DUF6483 family protein [bacterium]